MDNSLTQLQQRRNAESAGSWELAQSHRQRLTQLLLDRKCDVDPKLCVLGAGSCNDLDLKQLLHGFQSIDLVDIDLAALQQGSAAQRCQTSETLRLHGDYDVTGVWQELALLADSREKESEPIDQLLAASAAWTGLPELGTYGTVTSACVLSQLVDAVIHAVGEAHPRCLEVITAIRQRHLRLLYELTAPGGQVVLVTDFVSSETAPLLPSLSGKALSDTLMQMIKQRNFFTGLNPFRLQTLLSEDPVLAPHIHSIDCQQPWLWNFGSRHYAVTAISFSRN